MPFQASIKKAEGMIERLKIEGKEIVLVGTAHVSSESVKLVERQNTALEIVLVGNKKARKLFFGRTIL
ncbi:MAG TPA: hypothetical protein HA222_05265 [Candidatus Diapherotrites archaeon]|uniref:TraB family protein n=1 Tax=Candidatus Iainarchaeum sp. TaxID=3101447 RepID=A0A7J4K3H6_9ARCH|nr:hypothetical protein [Candidatus Diapherotrites archaeon]